eukprot:CAMPEP_0204914950 /NCGR_PEP_ID=MMETSP1397-20131031/12911_1 /ASSEMBLY_ACC=CAM_ASM_000891 /TAXON_ID=49980 /ORGANISM="Climacostomum Climacostomum virens, Strain Stock W-24" /LENGTH=71 /DNA_ID=CAMNT_0052086765 /DNA_START=1439 /DNA_END=1654 /DNA_ORIENTATION=-
MPANGPRQPSITDVTEVKFRPVVQARCGPLQPVLVYAAELVVKLWRRPGNMELMFATVRTDVNFADTTPPP